MCVLPLDDAVVVQLSLRGLHDGVLLPGDVQKTGLGETFHDVTHHPRQQLVWREEAQSADRVFHRLAKRNKVTKYSLCVTLFNYKKTFIVRSI